MKRNIIHNYVSIKMKQEDKQYFSVFSNFQRLISLFTRSATVILFCIILDNLEIANYRLRNGALQFVKDHSIKCLQGTETF